MTESTMTTLNACTTTPICFTHAQQAALARIAYCLDRPRSVALLCGPTGVGKTFLLETIAVSPQCAAKAVVRCGFGTLQQCLAAESVLPVPKVLLIDDAHRAQDGELSPLIERYFQRQPAGAVVLAGAGRLLSLAARDSRLEQAVSLRAVLPPFTLDESRAFLASQLPPAATLEKPDEVARTIHEIAAGIPTALQRLANLAKLLAQANPGRPLVPADIEAIHRRLSLQAA